MFVFAGCQVTGVIIGLNLALLEVVNGFTFVASSANNNNNIRERLVGRHAANLCYEKISVSFVSEDPPFEGEPRDCVTVQRQGNPKRPTTWAAKTEKSGVQFGSIAVEEGVGGDDFEVVALQSFDFESMSIGIHGANCGYIVRPSACLSGLRETFAGSTEYDGSEEVAVKDVSVSFLDKMTLSVMEGETILRFGIIPAVSL